MNLKEDKNNSENTSFARELGLFDATMIGVGAMIGAGIFVLTGIAAGEAGPASILAFALNGLVTLLTAFSYAELASAIPRAGGGYSFVRLAFPGATGFVAGWMLWFAYIVACSLYALGFAGYFWEFLGKYLPSVTEFIFSITGRTVSASIVTLVIGIVFTLLNARGAAVTGKTENILTVSKILVLFVFIIFGLSVIFGNPPQAADNFSPFFPKGMSGILIAMGLTFIAFEGYDLIATVAEEIKNPEKNIPKATFISLSVTVTIYLLILFVSIGAINPKGIASWEFLGHYGETAIVRAAEGFMPAFGVAIIVFGGLLSTMSALNATVMAASRVAFSMGRDKWLPDGMAKIHPTRKTPYIAIFVTGFILLLMAISLPIEAVGSAASLIFLLTFALVNLSVIAIRRKYPDIKSKYKIPFYPILPILGFILNIFLAVYQFNFQPIAWYLSTGWICTGLIIYYAFMRKRTDEFEPKVYFPQNELYGKSKEETITVALYNPQHIRSLLELAFSLAAKENKKVVAFSVVEVPSQMPIRDGMQFTHHIEPILKTARQYADSKGIKIKTDMIIAHNIYSGIISAVENHNAATLIMGWKGFTDRRDRIFGEIADNVIRYTECDLLLYKISHKRKIENCLLPTSGGPNARLASKIISEYAEKENIRVAGAHIVAENTSTKEREEAISGIKESCSSFINNDKFNTELIVSDSVVDGITKTSENYDLVVIGAAKEPFFRKMLFGEIPEKVARNSPTSVLVVKKYEGAVKTLFKKIMG